VPAHLLDPVQIQVVPLPPVGEAENADGVAGLTGYEEWAMAYVERFALIRASQAGCRP
jgi:hypothetical protein